MRCQVMKTLNRVAAAAVILTLASGCSKNSSITPSEPLQAATENPAQDNNTNDVKIESPTKSPLVLISRSGDTGDDFWMDDAEVISSASKVENGTFFITYGDVHSLQVDVFAFSPEIIGIDGEPKALGIVKCLPSMDQDTEESEKSCVFTETADGVGELEISGFTDVSVVFQASIQKKPNDMPSEYAWVS